MFVLNLAHFFTRLYGEGSRAANSILTYIWTPSSRSYIVFALELCVYYTDILHVVFTSLEQQNLISLLVVFNAHIDIISLTVDSVLDYIYITNSSFNDWRI